MRRDSFVAEDVVRRGGRGVAWLAGVDDEDRPQGSGEDDGGGQARGAASHDGDVVLHGVLLRLGVPSTLPSSAGRA